MPDAAWQRERVAQDREWAIATLGGKCAACGSVDVLEFDHIDRSSVGFRISNLLARASRAKLLEELKKCQLLCHDCHVEKSREEGSFSRPWNHGTTTGRMHHDCNCAPCTEAYEAFLARRRARRRARRALVAGARGPYLSRGQEHPHGTVQRYQSKLKCRCDECRAANTARKRERSKAA